MSWQIKIECHVLLGSVIVTLQDAQDCWRDDFLAELASSRTNVDPDFAKQQHRCLLFFFESSGSGIYGNLNISQKHL